MILGKIEVNRLNLFNIRSEIWRRSLHNSPAATYQHMAHGIHEHKAKYVNRLQHQNHSYIQHNAP